MCLQRLWLIMAPKPYIKLIVRTDWRLFCCGYICSSYLFHAKPPIPGRRSIIVPVPVNVWTHYGDVIMGAMASQITSLTLTSVYSIVYSGADQRNIKAPCHWPLCEEITGDRWTPAQMASNTENVSIWWRHHGIMANRPLPGRNNSTKTRAACRFVKMWCIWYWIIIHLCSLWLTCSPWYLFN